MPCLLAILMVAFPRVALALVFFFTNRIEAAYTNLVIPVLGFLFLPLTTLVYAWLASSHLPIVGINLVFMVVAVIVDLGLVGGSYRSRR